jgi:glycerol kinase
VLLGRAYVQCPVAEVRRDLAENLYEEETGGMIAGRPHPELFLEYPRGLGMDLARFDDVELLPAAAAYRAALERVGKGGAEILARMDAIAGEPHRRLVVTGGWAEGAAARAVKARHLGPFEHSAAIFTGARGAAVAAGRAAGMWTVDDAPRGVLQEVS